MVPANEEGSHTNISKLHKLVTLQNKDDVLSTYIEGVGTRKRILGMATGWGIGNDVRSAYLFLLENYKEHDKVYVFGFSRGAYASRILSSMLYVAGIPKTTRLYQARREESSSIKFMIILRARRRFLNVEQMSSSKSKNIGPEESRSVLSQST